MFRRAGSSIKKPQHGDMLRLKSAASKRHLGGETGLTRRARERTERIRTFLAQPFVSKHFI
jgi:hypothetical protein